MREALKGYKWWILGLLFFNVAFGMISYEVLAPLYREVSTDLGLNQAQFGLTMGLFHFASPFFTPIGGILVDRLGARKMMCFALVIVGLAGAARSMVSEPWMLMVTTFLLGVGFASVGPAIPKALGQLFPPEQLGKATGFVFSAFGLGNSFALATGASILSPLFGGWRPTMIGIGIACGALAVFWYLVYRDGEPVELEQESAEEEKESFFSGAAQVLKVRDMWFLAVAMFFVLIGYWGLVVHIAPVLDSRGIENFGTYAAVMTGTGVLFNLAGGAFSDWLGRRKPVLMGCVLLLACSIPGMLIFQGWALVLNMIIAGIAIGPILPMAVALPVEMEEIGPSLAGTAVGVMFMFGNIGSVMGPVLLGAGLSESDNYFVAFAFPMVSLIIGLIPLALIHEEGSKSVKEA